MPHPTDHTLNLFADGELSRPNRRRVAAHLIRCSRCRNTVGAIRHLNAKARSLEDPPVPIALGAKIRQQAQAGKVTIVPLADPFPRNARTLRRIVAAGIMAVLGGWGLAGLLRTAPILASETSDLAFSPARAMPGAVIHVEYRRGGYFRGLDSLVLRGRFRSPGQIGSDYISSQSVATLSRSKRNTFEGEFHWPTNAAYGVFAVEDKMAQEVDSHNRRGWELLVYRDSAPTFEALVQKREEMLGRSWEAALAVTRLAATLYPNEPAAWSSLWSLETLLDNARGGREDVSGGNVTVHQRRFLRLAARAARRDQLTPDKIADLYWYAKNLWPSNDSMVVAWQNRLLQEAPLTFQALQIRAQAISADTSKSITWRLSALEALWKESASNRRTVATTGWMLVDSDGSFDDSEDRLRWAIRYGETDQRARGEIAYELTRKPGLRSTGIEWLRAIVVDLDRGNDSDRGLYATAREDAEWRRRRRVEIQLMLGDALIRDGQIADGMSQLEEAAHDGWSPSANSNLAAAKLVLGDTLGAATALARVVVDPWTDTTTIDSLSRIAIHVMAFHAWQRLLAQADSIMVDRTMSEATMRALPPQLVLRTPEGHDSTLIQMTEGSTAAVVSFWSAESQPALSELQGLAMVAERVAPFGVTVLAIQQDTVPITPSVFDRTPNMRHLLDHTGAVTRAFGVWGTPTYFVIDAQRAVRFAYTDVESLPRQVKSLILESRVPPVAP